MTAGGKEALVCPGCGLETDPAAGVCDHCRYVHLGWLRRGSPTEEAPGDEKSTNLAGGQVGPKVASRSKPAGTQGPFWNAVDNTIMFVLVIGGVGFGLYVLAWTWPVILAATVLLSPIFLFFYVRSRLRRNRQ
jgi:hypothetical protein